MTIEEKAKAYDKAIERARVWKEKSGMPADRQGILDDVFPELKESEDEKIRKELIEQVVYIIPNNDEVDSEGNVLPIHQKRIDKYLSWLEKKGEQKTAEDVDILYRFSFYSYKDEPNILYLSGLYVNKEQRNKGIGTNILKIADKVTTTMKCSLIRLKTEIGSNAERLYRKNGYNSLKREGNQIWLEKQGEQILDNSAKTCKDEQKPTDKVEPKFH